MESKSLDPRVNRIELPEATNFGGLAPMDQWQTYEVFHQQSRGDQHKHVGIVHAPNAEIALLFAKEQYARRMKCVNLWVVRTADVAHTEYDNADMFDPATDKSYRESHGYRATRNLIDRYKKEQGLQTTATSDEDDIAVLSGNVKTAVKVAPKKSGIVIGKKS